MTGPLRVLVYGSIDEGVSDLYRFGQFREPLGAHGVELRPWHEIGDYLVEVPVIPGLEPDEAIGLGLARIDLAPLDWADVLVFRRWYAAAFGCGACDVATADEASIVRHGLATGHPVGPPERHLAVLLAHLRARGECDFAIVYDTDDDLLAMPAWAGFTNRLAPARPWIRWFLERADLVTVSTPVLAGMADRHNAHVRVVRNALDPSLYAARPRPRDVGVGAAGGGAAGGGSGGTQVRVAYHGVTRRVRDYRVARRAVDRVAAEHGGVRRLWLGSDEPEVAALVDEVRPYVADPVSFAAALAAAAPDVGLAPIADEAYNRARSELHWLEYSLVGAATVATRTAGPGPYDVVRDGTDGLLAGSPGEWYRALGRLVRSPDLRAELAGRARERVLAGWTVEARAAEWADAYRAALAHVRARSASSPAA